MYHRIVVAYDGSTQSAAALEQATGLARVCNAELHLLGVVVTSGGFLIAQAAGPNDVWGMERKYIEEALDAAARELDGQGVNVVTGIREGDPAIEIVAYVHQINADLAVLGHTDKGLLARWFQGSTGARLLSNLPCSLLIAA